MMLRNFTLAAAAALLVYLMGAVLHWSLDPGEWSMATRGILVFAVWPVVWGIADLVSDGYRGRW